MTKNRKILILMTSLIAIAACIGIIIGSTAALLSGSDKINISISSGLIDVEAYITNFKLYSANPDEGGALTDENGAKYSYKEVGGGKFSNGGTAEIKEGGNLEFAGVSAGDKVEFDIVVANGVHDGVKNPEAIRVKYQTVLKLSEQDENKLFDSLEFGVSVTQANGEVETFRLNGKEYNTTYRALEVEDTETVHISIALPVSADNALQNLAARLNCTLSAVQAVTQNAGVALVNGNDFMTLEQAVAYAQTSGAATVLLTDSDTARSTGDIDIEKSLEFKSLDGGLYAFKDARFTVKGGASVKISDMGFTGDSYFNIAEASSFALINCETVNCAPSKIYDEANREYLDKAGFIVSDGNQSSPVLLDIEDTNFNGSDDALAIYFNSTVADGSKIKGNTFGKAGGAFGGAAIELASAAGYSSLEIADNAFYADTAVSLNQKKSSDIYAVKLANNECHGTVYVEIAQNTAIEAYDYNSTINGEGVGFGAIKADGGLFVGLGVQLDVNGRVTAGSFKLLNIAEDNFKKNFVSASANAEDIIIVENN